VRDNLVLSPCFYDLGPGCYRAQVVIANPGHLTTFPVLHPGNKAMHYVVYVCIHMMYSTIVKNVNNILT